MSEESATLTGSQKLAAISWAAKDAGMSYGEFASQLNAEESAMIYEHYAQMINERRAIDQQRAAAATIRKHIAKATKGVGHEDRGAP